MTLDNTKTILRRQLKEWQEKNREARSDMSKMYTKAYVKCLTDVLALLEQEQTTL